MLYEMISQDEAKKIMDSEKDIIILDVRTPEEYSLGHIGNAINVPNEIIKGEVSELPDKNQKILVYCRSGVRSKEASAKLGLAGYKNILEFGGIIDWKY